MQRNLLYVPLPVEGYFVELMILREIQIVNICATGEELNDGGERHDAVVAGIEATEAGEEANGTNVGHSGGGDVQRLQRTE